MNMQAMLKQAQNMQKDMMRIKNEIDSSIFTGKSSFVTVEMKGNKTVDKILIDKDNFDNEDIDMLEDILVVALNDAINKIDEETEKKMSKFKGISGLF